MVDLNNLHQYRENSYIEAKQALGGLPESIWETYSAFANAQGGVILLGVEEREDKSLGVVDLLDPQWLIDDFWQIINDPMRVSVNILSEDDVQIHQVDGKRMIIIHVPRAAADQRPVYIENDIYRGTYYREGESDRRCTKEEIEIMRKRER